jgi:hypothetical protein
MFGLACLGAAGFAVWGFREAAGFREATWCLGDLPSFDEPLNMSDSQLAALASIGKSTHAAITATTMRRSQMSKRERGNFVPDDSKASFPKE